MNISEIHDFIGLITSQVSQRCTGFSMNRKLLTRVHKIGLVFFSVVPVGGVGTPRGTVNDWGKWEWTKSGKFRMARSGHCLRAWPCRIARRRLPGHSRDVGLQRIRRADRHPQQRAGHLRNPGRARRNRLLPGSARALRHLRRRLHLQAGRHQGRGRH